MAPAFSHAAAALLALSVLAGCSRSEPDQPPPVDNAVTEEPAPVREEAPVAEPAPAPVEPAPAAVTNTVAPPPAEAIAPDEQMLDDADATGMTARATRDAQNEEAPQANETEEK
ncbi:hypothetical protein FSB78_07440 [Sphingomonas ginsenosidivorax]|uniref:Uncharacterized protein n=2 Tax=Sphingomonas ginsenosidivorax TaxID=862135 RepID=A0A5C6UJ25_9SPHN|nr:hypothetical protein FSB78_07440 [Sphingomonas ginsenosidivorax]